MAMPTGKTAVPSSGPATHPRGDAAARWWGNHVLFLAACYLYLWWYLDPRLIAHCQSRAFFTGREFFGRLVRQPGGAVEYVSALATQSYEWPWAGAAVITAMLGLVTWLTGRYLGVLAGVRPRLIHGVPAILLLVMQSRYTQPLDTMLALVLALAAAVLYVRLPLTRALLRSAAFLAISVPIYRAAAGGYWLFALLAVLADVAAGRRGAALGCAVVAGAVPYVIGYRLLMAGTHGAFLRWLSFVDFDHRFPLTSILLYGYFPAAAIGMSWRRRARAAAAPRHKKWLAALARWPAVFRRDGVSGWLLRNVVLMAAAGLALVVSMSPPVRAGLRVDYCARQGMWSEALRAAEPFRNRRLAAGGAIGRPWLTGYCFVQNAFGPSHVQNQVPLRLCEELVLSDINRALYHSGRLLDEMFAYPQSWLNSVVYLLPESINFPASHDTDIQLDLGQVNEAERMACQSMAVIGPRPWILQRLAVIHAAKDEPAVVRVYLNLLAKTLTGRPWVRSLEPLLESVEQRAAHPLVRPIRERMLHRDSPGFAPTTQELLEMLLHENPRNRMAFEYLLAHYLLRKDLEAVARQVEAMPALGYQQIPRHVEEAMLARARLSDRPVDHQNIPIRPATWQRFRDFDAQVHRFSRLYPSDPSAVQAALARDFGDTYWFHLFYGDVPPDEDAEPASPGRQASGLPPGQERNSR